MIDILFFFSAVVLPRFLLINCHLYCKKKELVHSPLGRDRQTYHVAVVFGHGATEANIMTDITLGGNLSRVLTVGLRQVPS